MHLPHRVSEDITGVRYRSPSAITQQFPESPKFKRQTLFGVQKPIEVEIRSPPKYAYISPFANIKQEIRSSVSSSQASHDHIHTLQRAAFTYREPSQQQDVGKRKSLQNENKQLKQQLGFILQEFKRKDQIINKYKQKINDQSKPSTQQSRSEVVGLVRELGEIIGYPEISLNQLRNRLSTLPDSKFSDHASKIFEENSIIHMIKDYSNIQEEQSQFKKGYFALQSQLMEIKQQKQLLKQHNLALVEHIKTLTEQIKHCRNTEDAENQLPSSTREYDEQISALKSKLSKIEGTSQKFKQQNSGLRSTLEYQQSKLSNSVEMRYKTVISDLQSQNNILKERLCTVQKEFLSRENELQKQIFELQNNNVFTKQIQKKLMQKQEQNRQLSQTKNYLESTIKDLKNTLQQFQFENQQFRNSRQLSSHNNTGYYDLTSYCQELQSQLLTVKTKYSNAQDDFAKNYTDTQQINNRMETKFIGLESELNLKKQEINLWKRECQNWKNQLSQLKIIKSQTDSENISLNKRILSAQDDVLRALELAQQREQDYNTLLLKMQTNLRSESENIQKLTKINQQLKQQYEFSQHQLQKYRQSQLNNSFVQRKVQFQDIIRQIKLQSSIKISRLEEELGCRQESLRLVQKILEQTRQQQIKETILLEEKITEVNHLKLQLKQRSTAKRDQTIKQLTIEVSQLQDLLKKGSNLIKTQTKEHEEQISSLKKVTISLQKQNLKLVGIIQGYQKKYQDMGNKNSTQQGQMAHIKSNTIKKQLDYIMSSIDQTNFRKSLISFNQQMNKNGFLFTNPFDTFNKNPSNSKKVLKTQGHQKVQKIQQYTKLDAIDGNNFNNKYQMSSCNRATSNQKQPTSRRNIIISRDVSPKQRQSSKEHSRIVIQAQIPPSVIIPKPNSVQHKQYVIIPAKTQPKYTYFNPNFAHKQGPVPMHQTPILHRSPSNHRVVNNQVIDGMRPYFAGDAKEVKDFQQQVRHPKNQIPGIKEYHL